MLTRRALGGLIAAGVAGSAQAAGQGNGQGQQGHAPPPPPRGGSRKADVRGLRTQAEQTHPRGRDAAADPVWRQTWDEAEAKADSNSDGAFVVSLWRALSWFKDGHSLVIPFEFTGVTPDTFKAGAFGHALPIKVTPFHDGFWVVEAKDEASPLLGTRITSVNGVSDVDLMRRLAAVWATDPWAHHWGGILFSTTGVLQGLGVVDRHDAPVRMEARTAEGRSLSVSLAPRPGADKDRVKVSRKPFEREGWAATYGRGNYVHRLPRSNALYVSIDDMTDVQGMTFDALTQQVFAAMEGPAMQKVIIDLRRNGGGDNFNGEPLRKRLERSRFNRPGGLYVMTSPATFSAAQNLATRLERETSAIFVGEPTGSSPNHHGDAGMFRGEASGVMAIVSTVPWYDSYPPDRREWISPDIPAPQTFADWRDGRDQAMARVLAHTAQPVADPIKAERPYFFGRPSQSVAWKPFWR